MVFTHVSDVVRQVDEQKLKHSKLAKRILFISYDGMTDPLGQSQVIPYLQGLTKFGFHFTILSCEKSGAFEKNKDQVNASLKNYPIEWVTIPYHKTPPVFSSIYDVWQLWKKASQLHSKQQYNLVHTRPGVTALIGIWLKKKYNVKFLNDIREFYADSRVDGGMWNKNQFFYRTIYNYFKKKESEALLVNDGIVCLTHAAEKIIKSMPEYKAEIPFEVIPCSADMDLFDPEKITEITKRQLKKQLGIAENDVVVTYLGSVGGWYLTDEMMQCFKVICDKIQNIKFLFISPHQHVLIRGKALHWGLQANQVITVHAKRNEVPVYLSLSSFSLFFIKPCYSKLSSSPTKHGEIMAMGIPVISNSGVGDVKEIIKDTRSGFTIDTFNEESFAAIAEFINIERRTEGNQIRIAGIQYYGLVQAVEKYRKIYNKILKN